MSFLTQLSVLQHRLWPQWRPTHEGNSKEAKWRHESFWKPPSKRSAQGLGLKRLKLPTSSSQGITSDFCMHTVISKSYMPLTAFFFFNFETFLPWCTLLDATVDCFLTVSGAVPFSPSTRLLSLYFLFTWFSSVPVGVWVSVYLYIWDANRLGCVVSQMACVRIF